MFYFSTLKCVELQIYKSYSTDEASVFNMFVHLVHCFLIRLIINIQQSSFITNSPVAKSGLQRSKDKSPVPSLFKQYICEGLLRFFYNEIRLITKRILNPNNVFITQNLHDITKKITEQANRLLVFRYVRTITY